MDIRDNIGLRQVQKVVVALQALFELVGLEALAPVLLFRELLRLDART